MGHPPGITIQCHVSLSSLCGRSIHRDALHIDGSSPSSQMSKKQATVYGNLPPKGQIHQAGRKRATQIRPNSPKTGTEWAIFRARSWLFRTLLAISGAVNGYYASPIRWLVAIGGQAPDDAGRSRRGRSTSPRGPSGVAGDLLGNRYRLH